MEIPDKQELQALAELQHDPRFIKVMAWFKRSLDAQHKINDHISEDFLLRKGVGSSYTLSRIIEIAKDANDRIHRLRK